jgi:hypothetical protein
MTFHLTDPDGDQIHITPVHRHGRPAVSVRVTRLDWPEAGAAVHVPLDQLEELIAGLRDTARQAAAA